MVRILGYRDGCRRAAGELEEVGAALLAVWARHARSQRLATPLLRLADVLLAHAGLGRLRAPRSAFPGARGERAGAPGPEWACRAARMITRGPCNCCFLTALPHRPAVPGAAWRHVCGCRRGRRSGHQALPAHAACMRWHASCACRASRRALRGPACAEPGALLEAVAGEASRCRDVARLRAAAACLCHLAAGGGVVGRGALAALLGLLGSRLPRVRLTGDQGSSPRAPLSHTSATCSCTS